MAPPPRRVLVDALNVLGSRPDGWWRDRPAAVTALVAAVDAWCARTGAQATVVVDGARRPYGAPVLARVVTADGPDPSRRDAADDTIVALLQQDRDPGAVTVATSDGGLRERATALGARVVGARTFRARVDGDPLVAVTSARDPRVGRAVALLRAEDPEERVVALEDADVIAEATALGARPGLLLGGRDGVPLADDARRALGVLGQAADVVALVPRPTAPDPGELPAGALVLVGVRDAGNVGTIVRTALALGRPRVLLDEGCASPWSRRALRAAAGATLAPGLVARGADLATLAAVPARPALAAAVPRGGVRPEELPAGTVVVLGSEQRGLSDEEIACCDHTVTIPAGGFESLNVAAAAAILGYATRR